MIEMTKELCNKLSELGKRNIVEYCEKHGIDSEIVINEKVIIGDDNIFHFIYNQELMFDVEIVHDKSWRFNDANFGSEKIEEHNNVYFKTTKYV